VNGTITDVAGLEVGHYTDLSNGTGCTVLITRSGAVGGVDVRGSAPGTRETDLLRVETSVTDVHGLVLSGGSAYGLATADGVMRYLEEKGIGHRTGSGIVPIVPAAILYDLGIGNASIRPGENEGYLAAVAAHSGEVQQGTVGAGTGATTGKALGREAAMKGGIGSASIDLGGGVILGAIAAVNAIGSIYDPNNGNLLAGPRGANGEVCDSVRIFADSDYGAMDRQIGPITNTTIAVIASSLSLNRSQANRLATVAHDGLALAIRPCHTVHDGDTVFALSTRIVNDDNEFPRLCGVAASVMAQAIGHAVRRATGLHGFPSMSEVGWDA
jgi:L-aminopeptidase/D-esterase-like protein